MADSALQTTNFKFQMIADAVAAKLFPRGWALPRPYSAG